MKKIYLTLLVIVLSLGTQAQQILAYEYWLDDDTLNRHLTSFTNPNLVSESTFDISTDELSAGMHRIYFRTQDSDQHWSAVVGRSFNHSPFTEVNEISKMRYWTDTLNVPPSDLTEIEFTNSGTYVNETIAVDFCHLDAPGSYKAYFQLYDSRGFWSSEVTRTIAVAQVGSPAAPTVILQNDTLFSSAPMGNTWFDESNLPVGSNENWFVPSVDGVYYTTVENNCGVATSNAVEVNICDQIDFPVPAIIQWQDPMFVSDAVGTTQWNLNGSPIEGATDANYTPLVDGIYTLTTINDCGEAVSNELEYTGVSVFESTIAQGIQCFPNPMNDMINVQLSPTVDSKGKLEIMDGFGRIVFQTPINTSFVSLRPDLPNGIYLIRYINYENTIVRRIEVIR